MMGKVLVELEKLDTGVALQPHPPSAGKRFNPCLPDQGREGNVHVPRSMPALCRTAHGAGGEPEQVEK